MQISQAPLSDLIIIEPKIYQDHRGYFYEMFQQQRYQELGFPPFVQTNISHSKRHVLRGLHYQLPRAQGKLVCVLRGCVWDVAVDIRVSSPTFGQWFGIILDDKTHKQMYIPPGFAHGFCVLSETADFYYQCTDTYHTDSEHGMAWNDPNLNIAWPVQNPILSEKDLVYPVLNEVPSEHLFT